MPGIVMVAQWLFVPEVLVALAVIVVVLSSIFFSRTKKDEQKLNDRLIAVNKDNCSTPIKQTKSIDFNKNQILTSTPSSGGFNFLTTQFVSPGKNLDNSTIESFLSSWN